MQEAQRLAATVVERVLEGSTLPAALASIVPREADAPGRRRALVHELAYGTLRHWGRLDALVDALAAKPVTERRLRCLVAVAIYQLGESHVPAFAVVDRAVSAAAAVARPAAKGLVNAVLRRYLRERDALETAVARNPVARWSHPKWWIDRLRREYPDRWESLLAAGNARPPLALRVNARVTTRDALLAGWIARGIGAVGAGASGIVVEPPRPVDELPGFAEGALSVQDLGAQVAAPLLQLEPGQRVLDACAAPGGKTTHIAEIADVDLVAIDSDAARLERLRDNVRRLGVGARVRAVAGDAADPSSWWDAKPFDRILADVPCTASGVARRHPDIKWLRRESDVRRFARQQAAILEALWPCLGRGGLLLYATCSVFDEENDARMAAFCSAHADALRESLTFPAGVEHRGGQLLPSLPGACHNQDGFFYALLRKA